MIPAVLSVLTREIVERLAKGRFDAVVEQCRNSRLTADNLRNAVEEYGRTLVTPPANAYADLDAIEVKAELMPTWSIRAPLWTKEEGRSDLTLELTIVLGQGAPTIELDDLHVL